MQRPTKTSDPDPDIDPWGGRLERALRRAVPSFVHRVNNALGPVTGFASVAAREGVGLAPDRTALVEQQAERAAALARRLSEVSKPTEGDLEALDLVEWLREAEDFLDGSVEGFSAGVRLEFEVEAAPVRAAARPLEQALFVGLVEAAAAGARDLVIALRTRPEAPREVILELRDAGVPSRTDAGEAWPPPVCELAGAATYDCAGSGAAKHCLRYETLETVATPPGATGGPLVVVVERDPFLREEVEQVLIEQGYRVSAHERAEHWQGPEPAPAALLVDAVAASTNAVHDLLERIGRSVPVAVMGRPSCERAQRWPRLDKPFRPGELLERVATLVG